MPSRTFGVSFSSESLAKCSSGECVGGSGTPEEVPEEVLGTTNTSEGFSSESLANCSSGECVVNFSSETLAKCSSGGECFSSLVMPSRTFGVSFSSESLAKCSSGECVGGSGTPEEVPEEVLGTTNTSEGFSSESLANCSSGECVEALSSETLAKCSSGGVSFSSESLANCLSGECVGSSGTPEEVLGTSITSEVPFSLIRPANSFCRGFSSCLRKVACAVALATLREKIDVLLLASSDTV